MDAVAGHKQKTCIGDVHSVSGVMECLFIQTHICVFEVSDKLQSLSLRCGSVMNCFMNELIFTFISVDNPKSVIIIVNPQPCPLLSLQST